MKKLRIFIILLIAIVPIVCGFVIVDDSLHCDIQYELDGGMNSPENKTRYDKSNGSFYLQDPEKEGCDFFGWYTSPDFDESTKVTEFDPETMGDVTLYAKFVAYVEYLGNSVVSITEYGRTKTEIAIPKSCERIGDYAFENATNLTKITTDGCGNLVEIGIGAFAGCVNLESVELPASLNKIGIMAFDNKTLKAVKIAEDNKTFKMVVGSIVRITDNTLISFGGSDIPRGIEIIGEYALFKNTDIQNVTIPNTVKEISSHAFANCHNLETVEFEKDSILKVVGEYAFGYCYKVQELNLPECVEVISGGAFANCKLLKAFKFPENIKMKVVEASTFYGCESLEEINLPSGVEVIERDAFANCNNLTSIIISESVKEIDGDAFRDCKNLKSAVLLGGGNWQMKPFCLAKVDIDDHFTTSPTEFARILSSNDLPISLGLNAYIRFYLYR